MAVSGGIGVFFTSGSGGGGLTAPVLKKRPQAQRSGQAHKLSWEAVSGASGYLVELRRKSARARSLSAQSTAAARYKAKALAAGKVCLARLRLQRSCVQRLQRLPLVYRKEEVAAAA